VSAWTTAVSFLGAQGAGGLVDQQERRRFEGAGAMPTMSVIVSGMLSPPHGLGRGGASEQDQTDRAASPNSNWPGN
jgi:hypothetical protein